MKKFYLLFILFIFVTGCNLQFGAELNQRSSIPSANYGITIDMQGIYNITPEGTVIAPYIESGLSAVYSYIPTYLDETNSMPAITSVVRGQNTPTTSTANIDLNSSINEIISSRISADNHRHDAFREIEYELLNNMLHDTQSGVFARNDPQVSYRTFTDGDIWNNIYIVVEEPQRLINAQVVHESANAYYLKEMGPTHLLTDQEVEDYANEFESHYNALITTFAEPRDIDNNGKIIILFADFSDQNLLGYFYSGDKFSRSDVSNSNVADIFYINFQRAAQQPEQQQIMATLVHELQHMLLFDERYRAVQSKKVSTIPNDTWFNEGLSMLSEVISGYDVSSDVGVFLRNSDVLSLTNWSEANYGYSAAFLTYLYDRFDNTTFIRNVYDNALGGTQAVERATGLKFNDIFADFMVTMVNASPPNTSSDKKFSINSIDISAGLTYTTLGNNEIPADEVRGFYSSFLPYSLVPVFWQGDISSISADNISGIAFPNNLAIKKQ